MMNSARKMRLYVSAWYIFSVVMANENVTEWNSTTTIPFVVNLTSELLNSSVSSTTDPLYNETDASNFIATDYMNSNSTYLEHFTKFNWTVLDSYDENLTAAETNSSRAGYERNLMVVLPVMQGNSDLSNSNLQVLYTKSPVTAIIGGEQHEERRPEPQARTTIKMIENRFDFTTTEAPYNKLERIDYDTETNAKLQDTKRHHYTEFILNKPASKTKSPLDYGYPETFKFIEDFNELPKNHRPDWAIPNLGSTAATKKSPTFVATRRDPFQMFESVKPLEINKLLSFKPIPVTDSINEEINHKKKNHYSDLSTELPLRSSKRPNKRPNKKPQKTKTTLPFKFSTVNIEDLMTPSTISSPSVEDMYTAAKYTKLLSQTTAAFLPTPWREPIHSEKTVKTTTPRYTETDPSTTVSMVAETTKETSSTATSPSSATTPSTETTPSTTTTSSTTTVASTTTETSTTTATTTTTTEASTTRPSPTIQGLPNSTFFSTTECTDHKKHQIKPSDLINLKKILDDEFGSTTTTTEPAKKDAMESGDMLTNDMRNMLIVLGLLRNDGHIKEPVTSTTTTTRNFLEEMFMKREPAAPNIDPHSYVSFKKIPIDYVRQNEKLPVSDEMKDLLASFGLLPRHQYGNSLIRMARQHKMLHINTPETNTTQNVTESIENLDTLIPQPFNYQPHENGHVFHPTVHLETLGDEKLQKINHVIDTVKKLAAKDNATIEEVEEQLENITSIINEENISNDPFLSEIANMLSRTKAKIKSYEKNATIDLKTNSELNYKPDESSVVLNTVSSRNNYTDLSLMDAPSPLSSEELQQLLESNKNEVKRQQPSNNTSGSAPLPELAASFGGGETASEAPAPEDLPTARPNGLYFFVDWNTFLNVGETDKNPIRVRFAPRAGNPRNFVPITVP